MMDKLEKLEKLAECCLYDIYNMEITIVRYQMMIKLLDEQFISEKIMCLNSKEVYIYGGGYLGIQLFHVIKNITCVPAIVDKSGELITNAPSIKVISPGELKEIYNNQKIIITPLTFYREIYNELSTFIPKENLIHLEELLGGML